MAFIVKRDAPVIPAGLVVATTISVTVAGNEDGFNGDLIKLNSLSSFVDYNLGFQLPIRSNGGICYRGGYYVLVPPNVTLEWNDSYNWIPLTFNNNYWSFASLYYDDGSIIYGNGIVSPYYNQVYRNNSTNTSYIPQNNYYLYNRDTQATVFNSNMSIIKREIDYVYINGELYLKYTYPVPISIYFSAGNANTYYINISNPGEEYPNHNWLVFSASAGTAGGGIGSEINLEANKWYILNGGCGDGGCSIYIVSVNTSANQTSANIPLQNWPNGATITF
jgi:hypothetical protein